MDGLPRWGSEFYAYAGDIAYFGLTGYGESRGILKNVGTESAYYVRLKVTLYDPDGNYLTEKYAAYYESDITHSLGTNTTLLPNEFKKWKCWWVKDENMELLRQLHYSANPYRPDGNYPECFIVEWR